MDNKMTRRIYHALAALLVAGIFAALCWYYTDLTNLWYSDLVKPSFLPPDSIVIACNMALFVLMTGALFLVLENGGFHGRALYIAGLALALPALCAYVLFMGGNVIGAFILSLASILIWGYAAMCFYKRNKIAGYLLIPPVLWIVFATVLSYLLFMLN